MENKYEWKLSDIYKSKEDFEKDKESLNKKLEEIVKYKGILGDSSDNIYNYYKLYEEIVEIICKLYSYGMLRYHKNMADSKGISIFKEVQALDSNIDEVTAFAVPELTEMDTEKLKKYLNEDKRLEAYSKTINDIIESKKHILSKDVEEVLAKFSNVLIGYKNTYEIFTNTEINFTPIKDEDGNLVEINEDSAGKYLNSPNREVRKDTHHSLVSEYQKYINTLTELYLNNVKQDTKIANLRNYKSSLEKAVDNDEASVKVYDTLLKTVNENLNINHRYTSLKKKLLNVDELHMYDMNYNPFSSKSTLTDIETAEKEVLEALKPMGKEYVSKIEEAFNSNWMDVYPSPNKMGSAYNMNSYGVHPYVLMNYTGTNFDVSSIAHEFGHAMHSYYSSKNQNALNYSYSKLLAEMASTINEILFAEYKIKSTEDKETKKELLYNRINTVRATLMAQTMLAEFEKEIHSKVEKGENLNSEIIGNYYLELNKKYYGDSLTIDEYNKNNWIRIPHFFRNFYVYTYATGISCSIDIASRILNKEDGLVEKYIDMLKLGGSKKPIEILKTVGIDLEDKKIYENALKFYENDINELEKLI